jgi:RNA polymerase sigma factor (sigma-70 family)
MLALASTYGTFLLSRSDLLQTPMLNIVTNEDNQLIVELILSGDPRGGELLYQRYSKGLLFLAKRHCPAHAEDCMHDTVLAALEQIRNGKLQTPAALPGYLVTILKRVAWSKTYGPEGSESTGKTFDDVVRSVADHSACPSRALEVKFKSELMFKALKQLNERDQEILTRFYLRGQNVTYIAEAMKMTEQQVHLAKHRGKARLELVVTREMAPPTRRRLEMLAV